MADRHLIDVHVLLIRDDQVLLSQRRDPNPEFDLLWHALSGKLDAGESVLDAAVREAEEEVGVLIDPADLDHVHTIHVNGSGPEPRLGLFFATGHWIGEPVNREPDKCRTVRWFPLASLPEPIIDYPAAGIDAYLNGSRSASAAGTCPRLRPRLLRPLDDPRPVDIGLPSVEAVFRLCLLGLLRWFARRSTQPSIAP